MTSLRKAPATGSDLAGSGRPPGTHSASRGGGTNVPVVQSDLGQEVKSDVSSCLRKQELDMVSDEFSNSDANFGGKFGV